jgi:hypothetical protein
LRVPYDHMLKGTFGDVVSGKPSDVSGACKYRRGDATQLWNTARPRPLRASRMTCKGSRVPLGRREGP